MRKFKNKMTKPLLICGAAGLLVLGGTTAYLTDYDHAVNEFTVGKVDIKLEEPEWKPDENTKITPNDEIKKDPKIVNVGINDAFVYLQVAVPKADVITADEAGHRIDQKNQELFTFTANKGWTLIEDKDAEKEKIYTFAYDEVLPAEQETGSLFDKVVFANIIEGQLDTKSLSMPVKAYAIQTANTGGDGQDVPAQAKIAYEKYVNQNAGQDGKVME